MTNLDIGGVLSAHTYEINYRAGSICACDFVPTVNPETLATQQDYHRAHVAAVLREQFDRALAEEREMGKFDAMEKVLDPNGPIWQRMHGDGWDEGYTAASNDERESMPDHTKNPYRAAHSSSGIERAGGAG